MARQRPGRSAAIAAGDIEAPEGVGSAVITLDEIEAVANIGSYALDILSGCWVSSKGLDAIFGIDAKFERSIEGWVSLVHPEDREAIVAYFGDEVLARAQPFDRQYRIVRADTGEDRWVHGRGALDLDLTGRPVRMLGTIADMTEQHRVQEALGASERRSGAILEGTAEAILIADAGTHRYRWVNPAACALLGYTRDELLRMRVEDLLPAGALAVTTPWETVANGQITEAREVPCLRKDGSLLLVDVRTSTAPVDGVQCGIAFFADGSKLRRLERNLAEAQRIAHVGSWEFDPATGLAQRSDELHRILGVEPGAIAGTSEAFFAFVHPEDQAAVQASERAAMEGRGRHDLDFRIVRPDGTVRIVHEVGDVLRDKQGAVVRMTGTVEAVTERIAAGAERDRLAAELERRASYDHLTRVLNRASVMAALEGALARKTGGPTAVIFVDLDHFKEVNDRLGHEAGDQLLRVVADRLASVVRAGDALGRVGGDEFLIVCPGLAGANPAMRVAERLARALNQPVRLATTTLDLQASLGVASGVRGIARADALVRRADAAMYASKRDGRGQPVLYSSALARTQRAGDTVARAPGAPIAVSNEDR